MAHMNLVLALTSALHMPGILLQQDASDDGGVRIDFPGGTVGEYVDVLRRTYTLQDVWGVANIVLTSDADEFIMPSVRLRDVDVHAAIGVMQNVSTSPNGSHYLAVSEVGGAFTVKPVGRRGQPQQSTHRAVAVGNILDAGFTAEDILTAIEQMLSLMADDYEEPQLRFHEATGLLIGRGHPDQMHAMENVVGQLMAAADLRSSQERPDHESSQEISMLKSRLEAAQAQTLAAKREVILMETRIEAMQEELQRARNSISRLEVELHDSRRLGDALSSPGRPQ